MNFFSLTNVKRYTDSLIPNLKGLRPFRQCKNGKQICEDVIMGPIAVSQPVFRLFRRWHLWAWVAATVCLVVAPASTQAQTPPKVPIVQPTGGPWDSGDGFIFDLGKKKEPRTRQSLSGIACNINAAQERICLMVFDEGVEARYAILRDNALAADPERITLRANEGELDAEGVATDGAYFYITGSHSAKRSTCESNPFSRYVIRFRLDPVTGRALRSPAGDPIGRLVDYADTGRLWSIMQSQPELQAHVGDGKCLGSEAPIEAPALKGQHGVNIEGLAVKDGRLYFGFRGPAQKAHTSILAVDAAALFDGGDPKASVTPIEVGAGRGIRDMVAAKTGFLLLAGPDDDPANQESVNWTIAWWDGKITPATVTPKPLATLDLSGVRMRKLKPGEPRACDDKVLKPEAMTVLDETQQGYKLLVLSDGMCDGGALAFTVGR